MLIPHVVQTEADKVFVNVLNNQGSSVTDGEVVIWNTSSPDGVRSTQPTASTLTLVVGLADGTIAASAYGLAQAYGYKASGSVAQDTSITLNPGDALKAMAGDYLIHAATGGAGSALGFVYFADAAWATDSTSTATAKKVFIRAL